ncbi:ISL3 family transposase [Helcococcus kunzii]
MSFNNFTTKMLSITDDNITFSDEIYEKLINNLHTIVFCAKLTYKSHSCPKCGNCDDSKIIKHGRKNSIVRILPVNGQPAAVDLKKQRFLCKECKSTFIAETSLISKFKSISNRLKTKILKDISLKVSEIDIANLNNVSHSTVSKYIDKDFRSYRPSYLWLPKHISFDEFKSTKDADGSMSFIFTDVENNKIIDIVENRQLHFLTKYFSRFTDEARAMVETVCIDIYTPYMSLITEMFPNAKIILDRFHIVNLISKALNKTRIATMKNFDTSTMEYKRLKEYWKLILKDSSTLRSSHFYKYTHFRELKSQETLVEDCIKCDQELKDTYDAYQIILGDIRTKNFEDLQTHLVMLKDNVSEEMKTAFETLIEHIEYVTNALKYTYSNGYTEGVNNYIKTIKKVAFGYKSFFHFRNRILISFKLKQQFNTI